MWALGQAKEQELSGQFRHLFYKTVNHDMLLYAPGSDGDRSVL